MAGKTPRKTPDYENNPFFIATNGITMLFNLARGAATLFILLSVYTFFTKDDSSPREAKDRAERIADTVSTWSFEQWLLAVGAFLAIILALLMIYALLSGVSAYTSAELAKGKKVSLKRAFSIAFDNLWSYLWLQIIVYAKIIGWSLLLVVPGIYFAFRYSLAGVAFYDSDKNLRGNAAVKESLRLTKNGWITTFGSNMLFNLLTFGVLHSVVSTGVNAVLYKQFNAIGDKKPEAHWLSWLTLFFPFVVVVSLITSFVMLTLGIAVGEAIWPN